MFVWCLPVKLDTILLHFFKEERMCILSGKDSMITIDNYGIRLELSRDKTMVTYLTAEGIKSYYYYNSAGTWSDLVGTINGSTKNFTITIKVE